MNLKDIDLVKLSKLTSQQIDQYTCIECCKYYIAPEVAACGHTLCHCCWRNRRSCPHCAKPLERSSLRHNQPVQKRTEHVQELGEAFEKLFNINLNEFLMDTEDLESENDSNKNVKDWLASSQNHFSAPPQSSEKSSQETQHPNPVNVSSNKIRIHTKTDKTKSPDKVVLVSIPQDDWDKIEPMPDTEDINKNKENVVGPMDIEPFNVEDNEYTVAHPRRSSRKKEIKPADAYNKTVNSQQNSSLEKKSSKNSSGENDKKSNKTKQNWSSVKKMKKEFSKISKQNTKNKLNVSIEMCRKAQSNAKANLAAPKARSQVYDIDENTPKHFNIENNIVGKVMEQNGDVEDKTTNANASPLCDANNVENDKNLISNECSLPVAFKNDDQCASTKNTDSQEKKLEIVNSSKLEENTVKMPFYKRSALLPKSVEANNIKTVSHNVDSSSTNDDIEITIKVGNTITNILIKKKNDIDLKVNTDREIQTSLGPHDISVKNDTSSHNTKTQNILNNVGGNQDCNVEHQSKIIIPNIETHEKAAVSVKTVSDKKNTDSADTATAHFEITESVEKELSKIMECVGEPVKLKNTPIVGENPSQPKQSEKPATNRSELEYLNDLDIFESESVKESDVQLLKHTEQAPSEILLCTVKTKNKTQNITAKRNRDSYRDILPKSKKAKVDIDNSILASETIHPHKTNQNQSESEPMNYEAIMGTVFASIDADIEENIQSQNYHKEIELPIRNNKQQATQQVAMTSNEINYSAKVVNEDCNQKDSENVFSVCVTQKEDENVDGAPTNKMVPQNVPQPNMEDFLTPVMCRNLESTEKVIIENEFDVINDDDSDKSIVEETPQKDSSFTKKRPKSNGANKDINITQPVELSQPKRVISIISDKKTSEPADEKNSIITLTDTSAEHKSNKYLTIIEAENKKSMETPLSIDKFVHEIIHKSTPFAKKSLNFDTENTDNHDPEQTICPTNHEVARTTQEKEFLRKAFERSPSLSFKPLGLRSLGLRNKKYCIAGSCLTPPQIQKLKLLCTRHKLTYSNKFCDDLTHLVVGVDEENRSQRSVKYMCALASSKWIVSYEWVVMCLQSKEIIDEQNYEALDNTGEPGPMRSRINTRKLFQGFTFFCVGPFSVLDTDTLKAILEAAGGRVAKEIQEVRVGEGKAPAMLLAEPEDTQDNRFTYLTMEQSIVPVNYEWVLNCLGCYTLGSIQELLLCPSTLLPKGTDSWPRVLLSCDDE